ncbi:MAG TPA: TrmH family RNA methyltransferase [Alphaproteobacteria bacterium]|nr:TrmH family RNA methyltransferase [Alphaproteobacteria bacterium]
MPGVITSRSNELFKTYVSLQTSKGIDREQLALVSGRKIVPELLAQPGVDATLIVVSERGAASKAKTKSTTARRSPRSAHPLEGWAKKVLAFERSLFHELDEFGTNAPLLVLPVPEIEKFDSTEKPPRGLTLAVAAQDPSNLGAILRSALAFEVGTVVLLAECAHPFLPRVTRAASGANFLLNFMKGPSIKELDTEWVALDVKGESLDRSRLPLDCALLMGEEGGGIPEGFMGRRIKIPISTRSDSLNVAVAAGIVLSAYRRQYPLKEIK